MARKAPKRVVLRPKSKCFPRFQKIVKNKKSSETSEKGPKMFMPIFEKKFKNL